MTPPWALTGLILLLPITIFLTYKISWIIFTIRLQRDMEKRARSLIEHIPPPPIKEYLHPDAECGEYFPRPCVLNSYYYSDLPKLITRNK